MRRVASFLFASVSLALGGPFAPAPEESGTSAVFFEDPRISGWATSVAALGRGPVDIALPAGARASHGDPADALGPASEDVFDVVSLGDGGSITLTFATPIADRPGPDLAVFENGFEDGFVELAFVEVSSDGVNFFRFASESLTPATPQVGSFGYLDPTHLHNLAGKYRAGFGVPFELSELAGHPGLDTHSVTHVRILDVVGTVNAVAGSRDSKGRLINDPYPTNFTTGGFDLDGVAVLAPEPGVYSNWVTAHFTVSTMARSAAGLDPDGDGWTNLEECAFGGHPLRAEGSSALTLDVDSGVIAVGFPRVPWQIDLTYAIEFSLDLNTWREVARGSGGEAVAAIEPGVSVSESTGPTGAMVSISTTSTQWRYARVRIRLNP